jgi:hypothetical protein
MIVAESARISDIKINFIYFVISDILCCIDYLSGCMVMHSPEYSTGMVSIPANMNKYINIKFVGYQYGL